MLNRLIYNDLESWRLSSSRKPLVLRGARQVGKTVAVRMFSDQYDYYSELNMEFKENASFFNRNLKPHEVIQAIKLREHIPAETNSWLLFLDEIQACPKAMSMLRYFYEEVPEVHVIAAGSLLEAVLQSEQISYPVGRVEFRYLYPMIFEEFLEAVAGREMVEVFRQIPTPSYAEEELFSMYHQYALVGGMPEAVSKYVQTQDIVSVNHTYENLITAYLNDIPKYAKNDSMARVLRHCLKSAPYQAGRRIQFAGFGESNYKSREAGEAFRTLEQVMLVTLLYPTVSVEAPFLPNERKSPRLQFVDTGLIHYVAGVQHELIGLEDLSDAFRGSILEQLTAQEFIGNRNDRREKPLFWVRDKTQSQAEVDFIQLFDSGPLPVEVKSGSAGKLRSLRILIETQPQIKKAVRLYRGSYFEQEVTNGLNFRLLNIPYYHAAKIGCYLEKK
mgnify:CR=1 FL=1